MLVKNLFEQANVEEAEEVSGSMDVSSSDEEMGNDDSGEE